MVDLREKNILITGGSLGLGFACAQECLRAGGKIVIYARDPAHVEAAVQKLEPLGTGNIAGVAGDVTSLQGLDAALDMLESRFGAITSLVHAAAVQGPIGEITTVDPDEWLNAIRINLFGTFLAVRQTCARMKARGGRIVLFSGGGAAAPFPNYTAYACSKTGVVRFAETVAQEMAPYGIEINALAPGLVATRMLAQTLAAGQTPKSQPVPASVGAEAAAFLLSDAAAGITGKLLAARHDGWRDWPEHVNELRDRDIFTLRRIVPRDRGLNWQ